MEAARQDPAVISMRCLVTEAGASYERHHHTFEEFTLVTDDEALIGYAGAKHAVAPNTLCMYPPSSFLRRTLSFGGSGISMLPSRRSPFSLDQPRRISEVPA